MDKNFGGGAESTLHYKKFDHLCDDARRIRESVFVEEQGFKEEFDDIDDYATVLVFYDGEKPAGICRYFKTGDTYHIGRIAVLPEYRGSGLGSRIVRAAEREIIAEGGSEAELSAQRRAEGFYAKLGYVPEGEPYYEEYCEHIRMRRKFEKNARRISRPLADSHTGSIVSPAKGHDLLRAFSSNGFSKSTHAYKFEKR